MQTAFSKEHSSALKGIAILMLLFHHCFLPNRFEKYGVIFAPIPEIYATNIAEFCKVCVGIFAFISGYGLYQSFKNKKTDTDKWLIQRTVRTFSGYWFIVALTWIISFFIDKRVISIYFTDSKIQGIFNMMSDLFGLTSLMGKCPEFCTTWWYMTAILVYTLLVPVFFYIIQKYGCLSLIGICVIIPRLMCKYPGGTHWISFILAFVLGMIFSHKDLFTKYNSIKIFKNTRFDVIKFIIMLIFLLLSYKIFIDLPRNKFWEIVFGILPVIVILFSYSYIINIPIVKNILAFLGKHSANIFMVHSVYRYIYLGDFIYGFKYFALAAAVLLAVSLLTSILLELLKKYSMYNKFIDWITALSLRHEN